MTTKLLSLPILLTVEGVPKRARKARTVFCVDFIDVEVRMLSDAEAPVAVRFDNSFSARAGEPGRIELRVLDGRFYRKSLAERLRDSRGTVSVPVRIDSLEDYLASKEPFDARRHEMDAVLKSPADTLWNAANCELAPEHSRFRPWNPAEWHSFGEEEVRRQVSEAVAFYDDMIVVEGEIWRRVPEPLHRVRYETGGFSRPAGFEPYVVVSVVAADGPAGAPEDLYSMVDWARLAADCEERYGRGPGVEPPEVLLPEVFTYDRLGNILLSHLRSACDQDADSLKHFPLSAIVAWAEFRDATRRLEASAAGAESREAAEDALAKAASYLATGLASDRAKAHVRFAANAWDNEPIDLPLVSRGF